MFPYVMLISSMLFCQFDWPRKAILRLKELFRLSTAYHRSGSRRSLHSRQQVDDSLAPPTIGWKQQVALIGSVSFVALQLFLPFSHFLTPGYNNWTNGLYGYSWDMMVHSWNVQHVRIKYVDLSTGREGFIKPDAWLKMSAQRWALHPDTTKQYAMCIANRLATDFHVNNVSLFFDIWCSLNGRFQQRMWDPRVDLVVADWSPFKPVTWSMPLLTELSDWRTKLHRTSSEIFYSTNETEVVFVADFPGMTFETYIPSEFMNTNISALQGTLSISLENGSSVLLEEGRWLPVPSGQFISVSSTIGSNQPFCYQYTYTNMTSRLLKHNTTIG